MPVRPLAPLANRSQNASPARIRVARLCDAMLMARATCLALAHRRCHCPTRIVSSLLRMCCMRHRQPWCCHRWRPARRCHCIYATHLLCRWRFQSCCCNRLFNRRPCVARRAHADVYRRRHRILELESPTRSCPARCSVLHVDVRQAHTTFDKQELWWQLSCIFINDSAWHRATSLAR